MQTGGSCVLAPVKIVGALLACLALATSAQGASTTRTFVNSDTISVRADTGDINLGGPRAYGYEVLIYLFSSTSGTKGPSPSNQSAPLTPPPYYAVISVEYWKNPQPPALYSISYDAPPTTMQYSLKTRSGSLSVASTAVPLYRPASSVPTQVTVSAQIEWTCSISTTDTCENSVHIISERWFRSTSTGKFCREASVTGVITVDGTDYKAVLQNAGFTRRTTMQVYTP